MSSPTDHEPAFALWHPEHGLLFGYLESTEEQCWHRYQSAWGSTREELTELKYEVRPVTVVLGHLYPRPEGSPE